MRSPLTQTRSTVFSRFWWQPRSISSCSASWGHVWHRRALWAGQFWWMCVCLYRGFRFTTAADVWCRLQCWSDLTCAVCLALFQRWNCGVGARRQVVNYAKALTACGNHLFISLIVSLLPEKPWCWLFFFSDLCLSEIFETVYNDNLCYTFISGLWTWPFFFFKFVSIWRIFFLQEQEKEQQPN